jgi:hypothetical protein
MIPVLPVNMIPVAGKASNAGGFVLAVLIGLALFAASQSKQQATPPQQ